MQQCHTLHYDTLPHATRMQINLLLNVLNNTLTLARVQINVF